MMMKSKLLQIAAVLMILGAQGSFAEDFQNDDISDIPDYQSDDISDIPDVEDEEYDTSNDEADFASLEGEADFSSLEDESAGESNDEAEFASLNDEETDNAEQSFQSEESQAEERQAEAELFADTPQEQAVDEQITTNEGQDPQENQQIENVNEDQEALSEDQIQDAAQMAKANEEALEDAEYGIAEAEVNPQEMFQFGYELFKAEKWEFAAASFLEFIQLTSSDEKNYEWAEFFMAISLEHLGYTHVAVDRFSNLASRKPNTKIVSYILDMFEEISRTKPFDYDQVILQVVNDKDYGFISSEVSGFVDYYQGIQDWKTGYRDWAEDHFKKIPEDSYYYSRYLHQQALYQVEMNKPKKALKIIGQILKVENLDQKLRDESLWIAARLHYELGDLKEAGFLYSKIETPVIEQASFLLEQAWIEYQKQDYERAMGYLYAFEAPSFRQFFTPEYFLLKSFIYKDVCHYESALTVVEEFNQRYGTSLEAIYDRKDETDVETEELLYVILAKKNVKKVWDFISMLENEKSQVSELHNDNLIKYVEGVYDLQIEDSTYHLRHLIKNEYATRANALLQFEEESNLMRYEIGVDMYQRVAQNTYVDASKQENALKKKKEKLEAQVVFPFQREYWNDELGFYQVSLPNKCDTFKDWDLFF